jgi:electron transfer flavoprotein alpha subunit
VSTQSFLVVVERQGDAVADITFELLAVARRLADATAGRVIAVLMSGQGAVQVAALAGADRVVVVEDPLLAEFAPRPYLAVLEHIVRAEEPRAVLIGSTSVGLDLAPLLAAQLGAPVVGNCRSVTVDGTAIQVEASLCGGKMIAETRIEASPAVVTLLPGSYRGLEGTTAPATPAAKALASPVPLEVGRVQFETMIPPEAGDVDITQEDVLVAVGRGIQQEDNIEVAEELASAVGGQLCASRPIVDQGWLPITRQVGKSGMTVKPKCYFALGVSGAPEHVEGIQGVDLFIAVNSDPEAPIFDVAHYGIVGDLLDIVPAVTEALRDG